MTLITTRLSISLILVLGLFTGCSDMGEAPYARNGEVHFAFHSASAGEVFLTGNFAGWDSQAIPMERDDEGVWRASTSLPVGFHEYKFVADGQWIPDPNNPASTVNNFGEANSVLFMDELGEVELRAPEGGGGDAMIAESGNKGFVYLNLIWHQHQPYYMDASLDQLVAPWVRTHTTKDYYDMTAMLRSHPDVRVSFNFTPVLLEQIQLYVDRLGEFYDPVNQRIDADGFLRKYRGKTDPWIDLMLIPTDQFGPKEDALLFEGEWNCFSVSRVIIERWPEYMALREKDPSDYTVQDKLHLKCFFYLANFDPDFYESDFKLLVDEDGSTLGLTLHDLVKRTPEPPWTLFRPLTEDNANRILSSFYRIAASLEPLNRHMDLLGDERQQVEFTTTPYFHPILPLIANVHAGQSEIDAAPDSTQFMYEDDARWHVNEAVTYYEQQFGHKPTGMWPAEGSVSQQVVDYFADAGIQWIATGDGVLRRSSPSGLTATTPYKVTGPNGGEVAIFFRDTHLSDLIGFRYQRWEAEQAAEDLIRQIMTRAPAAEGDTALVTILLDGENAWEWYEHDPDAIQFLHAVYSKLTELQDDGRLLTVTPHEYLHGNPEREILAHPIDSLPVIDELWPGSWISANYATWVGEDEENRGWAWLAKVRADLRFAEEHPPPGRQPRMTHYFDGMNRARRAMYAAEGSDWFWWYGDDQNTGSGDAMWDYLFRAHLAEVTGNLQSMGYPVSVTPIPVLINPESAAPGQGGGGAMQVGGDE
jgi:alpha-amylase/alpha-mannosidase (GH57 family)